MAIAMVIFIGLTYLVGAFPFGLAVAKAGCGLDPRLAGSRNTGATNVARLCGTRYGVLTLVLDLAKGLVPVVLARVMADSWTFVSLVVVAAVVGHMYSVFLYGKGGKGVATTIGVFLAAAPLPALGAVAVCLAGIKLSGFVSVGSLLLVVTLPVLVYFIGPCPLTPAALAVAVLVVWKHRENIARLLSGQEKSWRKGRDGAAA